MAITNGELVPYYAQHRNQADPTANGGRPSNNRIISGRENNIWPPLTTAQRAAGQLIAEKVYIQNRNADGEGASDPMVFVDDPAEGNEGGRYHICWLKPADQDGMQSGTSGARRYGVGFMYEAVSAGATTLRIRTQSTNITDLFAAGDRVLVHDGSADPTSPSAVREFATVASVSGGHQVELTLAAPLVNSYPASGRCCSVYTPGGDWRPAVSGIRQSGAGTYDFTNHPLVLDNRGTIRQRWTLTYTGASAGELSGDDLGSLGAFDLTADLAPLGPDGHPYFTLAAAGHGNAHTAGDTLVFETYGAYLAVWWFKWTQPRGAAPGLVAPTLGWFTESA